MLTNLNNKKVKIILRDIAPKSTDEAHQAVQSILNTMNREYRPMGSNSILPWIIGGSYARNSAIRSSDIDLFYQLPTDKYQTYKSYTNNGQSSLLQEIRSILKKRFPSTEIKADGQAVTVSFNHQVVEVVPIFYINEKIRLVNSKNGGHFENCDPFKEIEAFTNWKDDRLFINLARFLNNWKKYINIKISGIAMDTLVVDYLKNNHIEDEDDLLTHIKEIFSKISTLHGNRKMIRALGSNLPINIDGELKNYAEEALATLNGQITTFNTAECIISNNLQPVLGDLLYNYTEEEEFIDETWNLDESEQLNIIIDCVVTDGSTVKSLSSILESNNKVEKGSSLEFYIKNRNNLIQYWPEGAQIYWKVKNRGREAYESNNLRGKIFFDNNDTHQEKATYTGDHFVECYLLKENQCYGQGKINVPIA